MHFPQQQSCLITRSKFWQMVVVRVQCSVSHIGRMSGKNSKVLQKQQHVTFKHKTDQSKSQNAMANFLFQKYNPTSTQQANDTEKSGRTISRRKKFCKTFFTSSLTSTIAREMLKTKEKYGSYCNHCIWAISVLPEGDWERLGLYT